MDTDGAGVEGRDIFAGGGEMGALMRALDWSKTPLGPVETWSASLRMMVSFMLANRFPLLLWWGPQYISLYNDAYRPVLGTKHPRSMGQPARECWSEIWHIIGPLIETPFTGGPATWVEDIPLEVNRHGFAEETHFTIAYSPVPDEAAPRGIGGVLATVHEITEKVVAERRGTVLRDLGARTGEARTAQEACAVAAETLANHPRDIPFALLYLIDADRKEARLAGTAGVGMGEAVSPLTVPLGEDAVSESGWPLAEAIRSETMVTVDDIGARFARLPPGPWSDPPNSAVVVPVRSTKAHQLAGLLVAGVSSRLRFDELYRSFIDLVAAQIATAVATAQAYEEERRRADALAAIDRAKTAFFSNVSHEFRTPLTLMLGPLEDVLRQSGGSARSENRALVAVAHRNGLRLLKLVNSLLDFSRIEAGRVQASYEPTDLAALTAELASNFRSACEKAGLALDVDCPPLGESVYVDRDMWEKIVLNLVSNAFKYTLAGRITVALRRDGDRVALAVRDTGTGIPEHEIPRLFERFHRIEGAPGRTQEGTGIGLALVQELVKLHGGMVEAESRYGEGSTFTVTLPRGIDHLPQDRIRAERTPASTAVGANPYVEEALRWLPEADGTRTSGAAPEQPPADAPAQAAGARASILLADDNADMRDYVRRLLAPHYEVYAVADGETALLALREKRPDLLLTDVMMPRLDGFGLLRAIRADPALADLPVILLSARAGEEASIEGLEAGADDYLIKPFNARELLARVQANLQAAGIRKASNEVLRKRTVEVETLLQSIPTAVWFTYDADAKRVFGNRHAAELLRLPLKANASLTAPPQERPTYRAFRDGVELPADHLPIQRAARGESVANEELEIRFEDGGAITILMSAAPLWTPKGQLDGAVCAAIDLTQRKRADEALRDSSERLNAIVNQVTVGIAQTDPTGRFVFVNERYCEILGRSMDDVLGRRMQDVTHPNDLAANQALFNRLLKTGAPFVVEKRYLRPDGTHVWVNNNVSRTRDADGKPQYVVAVVQDITERKRAEVEIARFKAFSDHAADAYHVLDENGRVVYANPEALKRLGYTEAEFLSLCIADFDPLWSLQRFRDFMAQAGDRPFPIFESLHRKKDGTVFPVEISLSIIRTEGKSFLAAIARDITERKAAEADMRELNTLLERKVAERSRALEAEMAERQKVEAALQQAQRLEAIGQLTGSVAHDFNNLLTVVVGQADSIIAAAEDNERIASMAAAARRAAERGAQLTRQLLAFARRQTLQPEAVDVHRLVANFSTLLRKAVGEATTVEIEAGAGLWPSLVDPIQLESAILNLAVNARDAMPSGGRLTVRMRNSTVSAAEASRLDLAPGDYVAIDVIDTGSGMPPDVQQRCFEPFFTTKDIGRGSGLGLSQIYGFARQSGGTATVESAIGRGTTIALYLPRAPGGIAEEQPSVEKAQERGQGQTILLVEDQPEVREVLEVSLTTLGYRILTARDGVEARNVLESDQAIDLLLTDVIMPNGISGIELAQSARRLRQDLKVVLISGFPGAQGTEPSTADGWTFLAKPFRQAELAHTVASALLGRSVGGGNNIRVDADG